MDEPLDLAVTGTCSIRGSDYFITLESQGNESMMVQVEDRLSADQWRSSFDAQYIEDLTHKTGNFKQFSIFASMLESAISKTSESVSLDLLTYKDLETLRQKKSGIASSVKSSIPASRTNSLTSKRYLILTYTVEFDRIHYPLPLPYVGKPDPRALQEEVRALRAELQRAKQHQPHVEPRIEKLMRDCRRLERERNEIEKEYANFRREVRVTTGGNAVQEIRALKTMVRNLEEQLMKEKTRYQRTTSKRSQEYRDLLEEVEELRASERNLRVRVKSLTNELALYKRGRVATRKSSKERAGSGDRLSINGNLSSTRHRSLSNDRLPGRAGSGDRRRSGSRERPQSLRRSNSSEEFSRSSLNGSGPRARSGSFDRNTSANRSRLSAGSGGNRSRTPSPAVSRRFNPTAYIKEKERRQKEADLKKRREHRANLSGISSRSKQSANSSRNSGYSYRHSRDNSLRSEGNISDGYGSDGSYTSSSRLKNAKSSATGVARTKGNRPPSGKFTNQLASTPDLPYGKSQSRVKGGSTADSGDDEDSEYFDRSAEISEIDERLDRLQQLMKATMP